MPLIELENVSVSYGKRLALQQVTCSITGGAVGLLGLNGAGKSTLIKTLLGFLRTNRGGVVRMFGKKMPRHSLKVRQRLGYMPERDIVSPRVSAVGFLSYCGCLFGMSRVDAMERAHEVLNYVRMGASRYQKMETYSTGQRQRVKFAQALIHDPRLLLLDEPTSGLDPDGRVEMLHLIRELAATRNVTVLLSSHLLPDIDTVCDRVIVIHQGKMVQDSPIEALTALTEGAYEVRVPNHAEAFQGRLVEAGFTWARQQNGAMLVHSPNGVEGRALFEIARACGTEIRHFRPVRRSLEDVFLHTIGEG
ncbi:MAG TPA: ABC transporter ATP-binding protein [Candidatus Hydrogenedentes bacterium]|nr:ABC transporter ATP-binding protein [Candidatus Hydrogenedentota bacterium]HPG66544.1 ABC transporter ATP-binding protein [Candidatus Hydrogenedentota bacterium]